MRVAAQPNSELHHSECCLVVATTVRHVATTRAACAVLYEFVRGDLEFRSRDPMVPFGIRSVLGTQEMNAVSAHLLEIAFGGPKSSRENQVGGSRTRGDRTLKVRRPLFDTPGLAIRNARRSSALLMSRKKVSKYTVCILVRIKFDASCSTRRRSARRR